MKKKFLVLAMAGMMLLHSIPMSAFAEPGLSVAASSAPAALPDEGGEAEPDAGTPGITDISEEQPDAGEVTDPAADSEEEEDAAPSPTPSAERAGEEEAVPRTGARSAADPADEAIRSATNWKILTDKALLEVEIAAAKAKRAGGDVLDDDDYLSLLAVELTLADGSSRRVDAAELAALAEVTMTRADGPDGPVWTIRRDGLPLLTFDPNPLLAGEKGSLEIEKKDMKGLPLSGASFTLSARRTPDVPGGDRAPDTFGNMTQTSSDGQGGDPLKFEDLEPGVYDFHETQAPEGYLSRHLDYVVVVQESGKVYMVPESTYTSYLYPVDPAEMKDEAPPKTTRAPQNIDGQISLSGYSLKKTSSTDPASLYVNAGEFLTLNAGIQLPADAVEGDTFTIKIDERLRLQGSNSQADREEDVPEILKSLYGNEIAARESVVKNGDGTTTITYKLTDYVNHFTNLYAYFQKNLYLDRNKVSAHPTELVLHNEIGASGQDTTIRAYFMPYTQSATYNDSKVTVGSNIEYSEADGKAVIYAYLTGSHTMTQGGQLKLSFDSAASALDLGAADVKVYKVTSPANMPASFGPDLMKTNTLTELPLTNLHQTATSLMADMGATPTGSYSYLAVVENVGLGADQSRPITVSTSLNDVLTDGNDTVENKITYKKTVSWPAVDGAQETVGKGLVTLTLQDKASGAPIYGGGFRLSNSGYSRNLSTGPDGKASFDHLASGTYLLEEVRPAYAEGYRDTSGPWVIQVSGEGAATAVSISSGGEGLAPAAGTGNGLTVTNEKYAKGAVAETEKILRKTLYNIENGITFKKVNDAGIVMPGTRFELEKTDGGMSGHVDSREADVNGQFSFDRLAAGNYELHEIQVEEGYSLPDGPVATFTVSEGSHEIENLLIQNNLPRSEANEIVNIKGSASFHIRKLGLDESDGSTSKLRDVTFKLMGKPVGAETMHVWYDKTDSEGRLSFEGLTIPSYYILEEDHAPVGYKKSDTRWVVHILADTSEPDGYRVKIYKNVPKTYLGNTKVNTKGNTVDADTGATVKPADLTPHFFASLDEANANLADTPDDSLEVTNIKANKGKVGQVIVHKTDGETGADLKGAIFELRNATRERIIATLVSDAYGTVDFDGLKWDATNKGIYYLKEIQAPYGYNRDPTEWKIHVDEQGKTTFQGTQVEHAVSEDESASAAGNARFAAVRSRITDVDYTQGTFTQYIYVNTTGQAYTYTADRYPILTLSAPVSNSFPGFTASNTQVTAYYGNSGNLPSLQSDMSTIDTALNASFSEDPYQSRIRTSYSGNTLKVDFTTLLRNGNAGVIKLVSKFDKASSSSLKIDARFSAYHNQTAYVGNLAMSVVKPAGNASVPADGNTDPNIIEFDVANTKQVKGLGNLEIEKTDGSKPLENVEFRIKAKTATAGAGSRSKSAVTDADGKLKFSNLPPGDYILEEVGAPPTYQVTTDYWEVGVDTYGNVTSTRKQKDGTVVAEPDRKLVSEDSIVSRVRRSLRAFFAAPAGLMAAPTVSDRDGILIKITNEKGEELSGVDLYMTKVSPDTNYNSDQKGASSYAFNDLTEGVYVVDTTRIPKNYLPGQWTIEVKKDAAGKQTYFVKAGDIDEAHTEGNRITVTLEEHTVKPGYIYVENKPTSLKLKKTDAADAGTVLEGASFELFVLEGSDYVTTGKKTTTNGKGLAEFTGLDSGKQYKVKEIAAPAGYKLPAAADGFVGQGQTFVAKQDGSVKASLAEGAAGLDQPYLVANEKKEPRKGKFRLLKQDENGNLLAGVEFTLYREADSREVKKAVTETGGTLTFDELDPGTYILRETKVPGGYKLSKDSWTITVKADGETLLKKADGNRDTVRIASAGADLTRIDRTAEAPSLAPGFYVPGMESAEGAGAPAENRSGVAAETEGMAAEPAAMRAAAAPAEATADDPMDLAQIYHASMQPPTEYSQDSDPAGKYPVPTSQSYDTVRNADIPFNNLYWYTATYKKPFVNAEDEQPARDLRAAGVNKYAKETETTGEYEINLKAQGNLVNPEERVDVMIVFDDSNSMSHRNAGQGKTRLEYAREAATSFIESVLSKENNPKGYIRMGLVSYGSNILDGNRHYSNYSGGMSHTRDYSHFELTTDPDALISKLPEETPKNWPEGGGGNGGTFTSGAIKKATDLLNAGARDHKKIIVHLTDGIPTVSLPVTAIGKSPVTGEVIATGYDEIETNVMGSGQGHRLFSRTDINNAPSTYGLQGGADKHTAYTVGGVIDGTYTSVNIEDHGFAARSAARNAMDSGIEIYNLGVELDDDSEMYNGSYFGPSGVRIQQWSAYYGTYVYRTVKYPGTRYSFAGGAEAEDLLRAMSSDKVDEHYYSVRNVETLSDTFRDIFRKIPQRTIHKGTVTDPMGAMVKLKIPGGELNAVPKDPATGEYVLYDGSANATDRISTIRFTASQDILKRDARVLYNADTETLRIDNITLAENDWVNLNYFVDLKTDDPNFVENKYYPANKRTTLKPNYAFEALWDFPVPSVKGPMESIFVRKTWLDADGNDITATIGADKSATIYLQQKAGPDGNWVNAKHDAAAGGRDMVMTLTRANGWRGSFIHLLKTVPAGDPSGNGGKTYYYRLKEVSAAGYESTIDLRTVDGKQVAELEGGIGLATVANQARKNIKFSKSWKLGSAPEDKKEPIKVKLAAYRESVEEGKRLTDEELKDLLPVGYDTEVTMTEANASPTDPELWVGFFEDLPLHVTVGDKNIPLIYRVEESSGVDGFEADYGYLPATNTNTIVNYHVPEVTVKNTPNEIRFQKVDAGGAPLTGASFQLKRVDVSPETILAATEEANAVYRFTKLVPGSYELIETNAPLGYIRPDTAAARFQVEADGSISGLAMLNRLGELVGPNGENTGRTQDGVHELHRVFNVKPMKIRIRKTDEKGALITEGSLTMSLQKDGEAAKKFDLDLTNQPNSGVEILLDATANGSYILREEAAPAGYLKTDSFWKISVDRDGRMVRLTAEVTGGQETAKDILLYSEGADTNPILTALEIQNKAMPQLPFSGWRGRALFVILALAALAAALIRFRVTVLRARRRRRRV